ncbi:I78 family peptidase inhibitor [Paragemmobacter straminiformis]|uniref:Peptidase inhibitor I78 family protein n=1 Tax=Paragemmobacter straminiformis TaxID=2045119 RepID=A0A842I9G5_9RHOB|nr:I78 family peptidase inhibitor [Gemmobacter straminiformis]MBC2836275.1 hypothetical protein [Gemmobacter straminiformis]
MKMVFLAGAMMATLAACEPMGVPVVDQPNPNQCGAYDLQYLVGSPDTVLQTMRFNKPVRIIKPGMAVTMDYNPDRINFDLDRYNMISRVTCG